MTGTTQLPILSKQQFTDFFNAGRIVERVVSSDGATITGGEFKDVYTAELELSILRLERMKDWDSPEFRELVRRHLGYDAEERLQTLRSMTPVEFAFEAVAREISPDGTSPISVGVQDEGPSREVRYYHVQREPQTLAA